MYSHGARVDCVISPSGIAAIATSLFAARKYFNESGVVLVHDNELYCDTARIFPMIFTNIIEIDASCADEVDTVVSTQIDQGNEVVFYAEMCSNPSGRIPAFNVLQKLTKKHRNNLLVVVDDTWTTIAACNPFDFGAHVVCGSLTKYYSGCERIGGYAMAATPGLRDLLIQMHCAFGMHFNAADADHILHQLATFKERYLQASINASAIMNSLIARCPDIQITHPTIATHPTNERAQTMLKIQPPIFTVKTKRTWLSLQEFRQYARANLHQISFLTSYGGPDTRVCTWPTYGSDKQITFRVAAGYANMDIGTIVNEICQLCDVPC